MPENTSNNKFTVDALVEHAGHVDDRLIDTEEEMMAALDFVQSLIDLSNEQYETYSEREFIALKEVADGLSHFALNHPEYHAMYPELSLAVWLINALCDIHQATLRHPNS